MLPFLQKKRFDDAVQLISTNIPGFEIRYKDTSWLMKFLAFFARIFNRGFMTEYTTTFLSRVYFPSQKYVTDNYDRALEILFHEFVHLWDHKKRGVAEDLGYTFPQCLALVPFLLTVILPWFISPAWLVILVGVVLTAVALCPWPAPFREKTELRGYAASMAFHFWLYNTDDLIDDGKWIVSQFTGWGYYRMDPSKKKVLAELTSYAERIRDDTLTDMPYPIIKSFLKGGKP